MKAIVLLIMILPTLVFGSYHNLKLTLEPNSIYAFERNDHLSYTTNFSSLENWDFHFNLGLTPFFDIRAGGIDAPLTELGASYFFKKSPLHKLSASFFTGIQLGKTRFQMPLQIKGNYFFQNVAKQEHPHLAWFRRYFVRPQIELAYNLIKYGSHLTSNYTQQKITSSAGAQFEFSLLEHALLGRVVAYQFGIGAGLAYHWVAKKLPDNIYINMKNIHKITEHQLNIRSEVFFRFIINDNFHFKMGFKDEYRIAELVRSLSFAPVILFDPLLEFSYTF